MTHGTIVAIDAGQTGMKVRVQRVDARPVDSLSPGVRTDAPLAPQLAAVARAAAAGDEIAVVAAGVSGLIDGAADGRALREALGGVRVMIAHDSITSYLGALGDRTGAVVAAGGGVVTLGVGRSRVARVDGWGYIMGDAGSGYWIGRAALDAVMRAHDGRAEPTALTPVVQARWPDLETAYVALQSSADRVAQVASFARSVADAAADGDPAARRISAEAGRELAWSVDAALRRVAEPGAPAPAVAAIGGVFGSAPIRAAFAERLAELQPSAAIEPARGAGIDGAMALLGLAAGHPLLGHVFVAGG